MFPTLKSETGRSVELRGQIENVHLDEGYLFNSFGQTKEPDAKSRSPRRLVHSWLRPVDELLDGGRWISAPAFKHQIQNHLNGFK
jgi:hypothetical protein